MKTTKTDTASFILLNAVLALVALLALVIPACCVHGTTRPTPTAPLLEPATRAATVAMSHAMPSSEVVVAAPIPVQVAMALPLLRTI